MKEDMKAVLFGIAGGIVAAFIITVCLWLKTVPDKIYQIRKNHSSIQTICPNVEDKYYEKKYYGYRVTHSQKEYKIIVKYNNKEKEIEVSKDDFYKIKVGDKVLCDIYCQGKKIVAVELNNNWKRQVNKNV